MQCWLVLTAKGMKLGMIGFGTGIGLTFSNGGRSLSSIPSSTSSRNDLIQASSSAVWRTILVSGSVRATLPPSTLFADSALLLRGYTIAVPKPRAASCICCPLGLTLGQVYNPSRLQLTRQRFDLNRKVGDPWTRCWP